MAFASPIGAAETPLAPLFEPPPLAGHDADAEALWRRLFFDTAGREIGEAGVSCDHRRARRPEAIRGIGFVAVATDAKGRVRARLWGAPEAGEAYLVADRSVLGTRLRALLSPGEAAADFVVDARVFSWCR